MLTLDELKRLLHINALLTVRVMRSRRHDALQRLHELSVHRMVLKDCIIELLSIELTQAKAA